MGAMGGGGKTGVAIKGREERGSVFRTLCGPLAPPPSPMSNSQTPTDKKKRTRDDVAQQQRAQRLVVDAEEPEQQRQQRRRVELPAVAQQDERLHGGAAQGRVQGGRVLVEQRDEPRRKAGRRAREALGDLAFGVWISCGVVFRFVWCGRRQRAACMEGETRRRARPAAALAEPSTRRRRQPHQITTAIHTHTHTRTCATNATSSWNSRLGSDGLSLSTASVAS